MISTQHHGSGVTGAMTTGSALAREHSADAATTAAPVAGFVGRHRSGGRLAPGGRAAADGPVGRAVHAARRAPGQRRGRVQQGRGTSKPSVFIFNQDILSLPLHKVHAASRLPVDSAAAQVGLADSCRACSMMGLARPASMARGNDETRGQVVNTFDSRCSSGLGLDAA